MVPSRTLHLVALVASLALCACRSEGKCAGPAPTRGGLNLTIVSAANSKFAAPQLAQLVQLREKMEAECMLARARVITYDLGFHDCERDALRRILPMLGPQFELRTFEFAKFPKHVAQLGCYAWKAPIVRGVADEVGPGSVVMWIDSGARFAAPMASVIEAAVGGGGFVSGQTGLTVRELTHPAALAYFADTYGLPAAEALRLKPNATYSKGHGVVRGGVRFGAEAEAWSNCDGAFSAHWKGSARFADVTVPWDECARVQACVCPPGSSRSNHRQDQAALTLLAIRARHDCGSYEKLVQARALNPNLARFSSRDAPAKESAAEKQRSFCARAADFQYPAPR